MKWVEPAASALRSGASAIRELGLRAALERVQPQKYYVIVVREAST